MHQPSFFRYYSISSNRSYKLVSALFQALFFRVSFQLQLQKAALLTKISSYLFLMMFLDCLPNSTAISAIFMAVALAVSVIKFHGRKSAHKERKHHPIAGTVLHQVFHFHRLLDYMTDLARERTSYRLFSFLRSEVYTADPVNVEYILKTNFSNYGKGWYHYSILTDLLGDGIFTVDGEKWRHQRKAASYEFTTKNLRDFSCAVFKSNAVILARLVSEAAIFNQPIEVQDLFMKSTLDTVFKIVLGVELDTVCGTYEEGMEFSKAFDEASACTMYRYFDPLWKIKRFLNIGSEAVLSRSVKVVDEFVYKIIRRKTEQVQSSKDDMQMKKGDILSRFLELEETEPKYLRDIILSFMIAGKDTTATTLSWFIYLLCKHPYVQERIVEDIKEATKLNDNSSIEELADSITDEALDKMQYLHAALSETLRLYPAVPVEGKLCFSDDIWPDGHTIRKGDLVSFQPYTMGRMTFLWGEDAEEFRPERWLNENGNFQQESPFKFTAFQAGPRICLGKEFAYRQMMVFSAVLLGSHKFKLRDQTKAVNYRTMLTQQIDGGLHLNASRRFEH